MTVFRSKRGKPLLFCLRFHETGEVRLHWSTEARSFLPKKSIPVTEKFYVWFEDSIGVMPEAYPRFHIDYKAVLR